MKDGFETAPPAGSYYSSVRLRASDLASLDELLYGSCAAPQNIDEKRLAWIIESVSLHLETCEVYRRVSEHQGFDLESLKGTGDLGQVPLLSSGTFKRRRVESHVVGAVKACTSSGTRGTQSMVIRDRPTLERFVGTVVFGVEEFLGHRDERDAFVLGPTKEDAGDLWFSYVLSLIGLLYETRFLVTNDIFRPGHLYEALSDASVEAPLLVGPPTLLYDFLCWMEAHGRALQLGDRGGLVVTAGGWKRRANEEVDRAALTEMTVRSLGVPEGGVRDAFNMVELNTVIQECEHHQKHIPPWLHVIARRPADLSLCANGEEGLLSYLDPTPTSYPGFVLSDDFGSVQTVDCPCGRMGEVLRLRRRMQGIEERGCGLKMDRYRTEEASR
jgi:long-chain-fatty-acid---luciferin-component ligase